MSNTTTDKPECEFACVGQVRHVNNRPHPFMVGRAHVTYAPNRGGILGEEALRSHKCYHRGCGKSYDEHTSDYVAFIELKRDCSKIEMRDWLVEIKPWLMSEGIDGVAFLACGHTFTED